MDHLCFFLSCVCYVFVFVWLFVPCGHLLGKGWPFGPRLWSITVSLSLSHCYPGSGVVLDCIDSWSFHPYLLYMYSLFILCLSTKWHTANVILLYIWKLTYNKVSCNLYLVCILLIKVRKTAKIRKRYKQVSHLSQDTTSESNKNTINITNKSQGVSPTAGNHKAAMNRRESMRNTRHKKHKWYTKEVPYC